MFDLPKDLTLRDYFAARAMAAMMPRWGSIDPSIAPQIALLAYGFADALLAEREKSK